MELRDLRYFCLVAELENVSSAAKELGVTQPYITKIINQLEKEMGVKLFDNPGRKVKLNHFGDVFYGYAKKVLMDIDNLYIGMDQVLEQHEQTVTILSDAEAYSSDIVLGYKKLHPDCNLSFTYATRKDIIEALVFGTTDFGLTTPPIETDPLKGIITEVVLTEHACALLPPGHRYIGRESVTLEDMKGEPLVTSPRGAGMRNNIEWIFDLYNYHARIVCETNNVDLQIKAVMSGMGYAWMPHMLMFRDPELRKYCVDLNNPDAVGHIGLSYNRNTCLSKNADDLKQFIKDYFENLSKTTK